MAVKEGYVDPTFLQKVKELDRFSQKVRHRMMTSLVGRRGKSFNVDPKDLLNRVAKEMA
jgi:hypothetical protein